MANEISIIPEGNSIIDVETSIQAFNQPLAKFLNYHKLPVENILIPVEERRKVIFALSDVLEILPYEKREKAYYLSKFTVSIVSGLFDGALNFLWDETVQALRRLVISYDLHYFYSIAEQISKRYKGLDTVDDISSVAEFDLLEICRRIGLLSDVAYKSLENINYMRNHASAAHPNENELTGYKMISFVEDCIKYAINAEPDFSLVQIKTLFNNIRMISIPDDDFGTITDDLVKLPIIRLDDFLLSLYGIFCDDRQGVSTYQNIEKLVPKLWRTSSEDVKYQIGSKYGLYRKNGDVFKKDKTQRFLEITNGLQFKDEDSLAAELIEKLQDLRAAHFGMNNFYNEYIHAKNISESLPKGGIPDSVRHHFVKMICICYVGNGLGYRQGVDEGALPYYSEFIDNFSYKDVKEFILLFQDDEFTRDFDTIKADNRVRDLSIKLKSKTTDIFVNKALDLIAAFGKGKMHKIHTSIDYKNIIKDIK